ncbi:MAG: hypothetical protein QM791_19990 [Ferruginibacter sp.]
MSNMDNFDNYVKNSLGNYAPPLPDGMWDRIHSERERRKPGTAWFLNKRNLAALLAALLFLGGGTYWLASSNKANDPATEKNIAAKENHGNDKSTITQPVTDNNPNNNSTELKDQPAGNTITDPATGTTTLEKSKATLASKTGTGNNLPADKTTTDVTANNTTGKSNLNNNTHRLTKNKKHRSKSSLSSNQSAAEIETLTSETVEIAAAEENGLFSNRLSFNNEKLNAFTFKEQSRVKPNLNSIFIPSCPTIEKDAAGNKSYWEFYAGPDYAMRRYTDTSNSVYMQRRKATLSYHSAYSAGIRYTKVFGTGVSVRTGINYSQVNEKFTFLQSNIVQVNYIIDPVTGDTTGSYTVRGSRYKTTYNHFRSFDIPVLFGYEMGNGRFHANINAGAMINIYSWQNGETLDTTFQPVSFSSGKGDNPYQYKTNIGVGFTAAASLYYRLTERLHALAEPYIRYNLSPMNKDNLSLQERFTTIGLRLGVRIDLQ